MKKVSAIIRLFRFQASILMNLFIFLPLYLFTHDWRKALLCTLPFILMISGEIALNDCCDIKKDAVNKPHRPLVSGLVGLKCAWICVSAVLLTSVAMAYVVYKDNMLRFSIFVSVLLILSLYNLKLGWIAVCKGFITALCTVICLSFICTFISVGKSYILFLIAAFLFIFGRELMMDIRDIEGDKAQDYNTIAVRFGEKRTAIMALALIVLSNIVCFAYVHTTNVYINYYLFLASILAECGIVAIFIITKNNKYRNKAVIFLWVPMLILLSILLISLPKPT